MVKCREVLQCNGGTSNKLSNILKRHIENRKLLLICILLLSHSLIFFSFLFYKNMVVNYVFLFSVGQGLLNVEVSRSHSFRRSTIGRTTLDE